MDAATPVVEAQPADTYAEFYRQHGDLLLEIAREVISRPSIPRVLDEIYQAKLERFPGKPTPEERANCYAESAVDFAAMIASEIQWRQGRLA